LSLELIGTGSTSLESRSGKWWGAGE